MQRNVVYEQHAPAVYRDPEHKLHCLRSTSCLLACQLSGKKRSPPACLIHENLSFTRGFRLRIGGFGQLYALICRCANPRQRTVQQAFRIIET
jgi:hypothetical protein